MICGGENGTNGYYFVGFSEDIAFSLHFVPIHLSPTLPPYRSTTGIGYASKNYLKWQKIQPVIHPIVGG